MSQEMTKIKSIREKDQEVIQRIHALGDRLLVRFIKQAERVERLASGLYIAKNGAETESAVLIDLGDASERNTFALPIMRELGMQMMKAREENKQVIVHFAKSDERKNDFRIVHEGTEYFLVSAIFSIYYEIKDIEDVKVLPNPVVPPQS